jgi:hypothetical protein
MTVFAGLAGGFAAVFESVTFVAAGLGGIVFRSTVGFDAAGVLEGAGSVPDLAGLVEPVAGFLTWGWGVLLFGLADSSFLMISSMISKN